MDTGDAKSTSNLWHHARICWGDEAVEAADSTRNIKAAHAALKGMKTNNGSVAALFQKASKGRGVIYSYCQHTKIEAWYVVYISFDLVSETLLSVLNSSAGSQKTTDLFR